MYSITYTWDNTKLHFLGMNCFLSTPPTKHMIIENVK